jgi:hypothetical protein
MVVRRRSCSRLCVRQAGACFLGRLLLCLRFGGAIEHDYETVACTLLCCMCIAAVVRLCCACIVLRNRCLLVLSQGDMRRVLSGCR